VNTHGSVLNLLSTTERQSYDKHTGDASADFTGHLRSDVDTHNEIPHTSNSAEPVPRPASCSPGTIARASSFDRPTAASSFLQRFLSSFFEERNIKWLLIIGAGIVFGSSLMLVTREWSHWSVSLRYLTVLCYTAVAYGTAEFGRRRLGLRTTSSVLYALTLLLLPVCFAALSWMSAGTATQPGLSFVQLLWLLAPTAALAWFAASHSNTNDVTIQLDGDEGAAYLRIQRTVDGLAFSAQLLNCRGQVLDVFDDDVQFPGSSLKNRAGRLFESSLRAKNYNGGAPSPQRWRAVLRFSTGCLRRSQLPQSLV